jgi:sulfite exporter TauE/SafE
MLGIAALSHHLPSGIALMAGVGLGTAPGLLMVGLFGAGLNRSYARVGMRAAGVIVVALGLLTIGRATGIVHAKSAVNKVIPPCCGEHAR